MARRSTGQVVLDAEGIEAIAQRVVELLREDVTTPRAALLHADEVARRLGRSRDFVYRHRPELGAVPLGPVGAGRRPRLGFDPEQVESFARGGWTRPDFHANPNPAASPAARGCRAVADWAEAAQGPRMKEGAMKIVTPKMERTRHPGIFKRGGSYVAVWRHRGKQHKSFHPTLAEAREAKGRRATGDTRPASREPFEDYAGRWIDTYRGRTARGLSARTRATYKRDLERWAIPHFRGLRLEEVEPPDVRAFVGHIEAEGLRPNSVRAILAPVKAMYATAVEDGTVRSNPTRNVRVGGQREESEREVRAMTRSELARLLGHTPEQWRLLFELLAQSGLRISEAIGLTWADVEFGASPRLLVRRQDCRGEVGALKTEGSRRDVPLSPRMAKRLWAIGADRPGTDRVFTSPHGFPLSYGNLRRRALIPATEAAGLGALDDEGEWRTWVTFHTFRHTCASLLFEAGRDVKQVSAWLGHADAGFTLRTYVHLMDEGVGDAEFMDDAVKVGNRWATQDPETAANGKPVEVAEIAG